jgi:hypothetical protein
VLFQVTLVVQAVLALMVCPAVEESGGATQQVRGALFYCPAQAREGSAPRRDAARQLIEKVSEEREMVKKSDRKKEGMRWVSGRDFLQRK